PKEYAFAIYFGAERILGYSTDMSWTSSPRNMGKFPRKTHALTSQFKDLVSKTTTCFVGTSKSSPNLCKSAYRYLSFTASSTTLATMSPTLALYFATSFTILELRKEY